MKLNHDLDVPLICQSHLPTHKSKQTKLGMTKRESKTFWGARLALLLLLLAGRKISRHPAVNL